MSGSGAQHPPRAWAAVDGLPEGDVSSPGQVADPVAGAGGSSAGRTLVKGGAWSSLAQFSPVVTNIALTPYVIAELGIVRFGLYALLLTLADFLASFDGGVYRSGLRYFALYAGNGDRAAATRLFVGLCAAVSALGAVLFVILFLSADTLLSVFRVPSDLRLEGDFMLKTLAITIGFGVLRGVVSAVLNARQRFAYSSIVTIFHYGLYAVGVLISLSGGYGLRGIAVTLVVQTVVSTVLLALPVFRYFDRRAVGLPTRAEAADFARFSSRAQVVGLADLVNLQSQPIVIGAFLGVGRVGLYSAGANFASQLRRLPTNAINPAGAILARTWSEHGPDAALEEFRRLQRLWVLGVTGWTVVAAAAAWFGITKWLGDGFELAGTVAVLLLVSALFRLWTGMTAVYMQSIGHPELEARAGLLTVAINVALALALVVPFGVLGVVAASVVAQLAGNAYLVRIVRRRFGPEIPSFLPEVPWASTAVAVVVTVGLELLVRPYVPQGPIGLLLCGAAAAPALVLFTVLVLGPAQTRAFVAPLLRRLPGRAQSMSVGS